MVDNMEKKILVREFDEDRDIEMVGKLERNCEVVSKMEVSNSINMTAIGDPLCRVRFYPLHVMLVAELLENGDLVGVVRGCIKGVGTGFEEGHVRMGCILGLRVSPAFRRMGIGLKLVNSVEEWLLRNGAEYTFLATEKTNIASVNLFTLKCNYVNLSSLVIFVQPICFREKNLPADVKIEKLRIDQAVSLYKKSHREKKVYPADIATILKEKLSLGTWVCYYKEDSCINLLGKERTGEISKAVSSWIIFSVWNTCEAYKLQIRKSHPLWSFHASLLHAREKIFPCLGRPTSDSIQKPIGFLFLYGLLGEGEKLGELMKSVWSFASKVGRTVKDCRVVITELGVGDPLVKHIPQEPSMSRIDDLWYAKKMIHQDGVNGSMVANGPVANVFVDPRDF